MQQGLWPLFANNTLNDGVGREKENDCVGVCGGHHALCTPSLTEISPSFTSISYKL